MRLPAAFARVLPVFKTGIVMKRFISKIFSSLGKIAGLVLAFGYSSCFPVAYGSPTADYRVKGKVTDILNNPLEGIQVIVEDTDEVFEKDGKGIDFEYEISDGFWPTDELEFVERAIDTFLEQENASEEISKLKEQLEKYKAVFGDILFPAEPGTAEFEQRREIQENPAGRWMYSDDGFYWKLVPQDTGKIDFSRVMLRKLPDSVFVGVNQDVCMNPEDYLYSFNFGMSWDDLYGCDWIYHSAGRKAWFKRKEEKR